jgi:hypothetical protein
MLTSDKVNNLDGGGWKKGELFISNAAKPHIVLCQPDKEESFLTDYLLLGSRVIVIKQLLRFYSRTNQRHFL